MINNKKILTNENVVQLSIPEEKHFYYNTTFKKIKINKKVLQGRQVFIKPEYFAIRFKEYWNLKKKKEKKN